MLDKYDVDFFEIDMNFKKLRKW